MPIFAYQAYTGDGRRTAGREQAASAEALKARLKKSGLFLRANTLREARTWLRNPRRIKLPTRELIAIFEQLELQLSGAVLTDEALETMVEASGNAQTRFVLREIHEAISAGKMPLAAAFAQFPRSFPPEIVTVIRAGDASGQANLAKRFGDLRERLAFFRKVRATTLRAFQYPAILTAVALAFIVFVVGYLIPMFAEVLRSVGQKLPPLTEALANTSHWLGSAWPFIAAGVGAAVVGWGVLWRTPRMALLMDGILIRLPYFGRLYRSLATSIIFRTYASLYEAGATAPENLEVCAKLVKNRAMRAAVNEVRRNVLAGDELSAAFRKTRCFPLEACALVRVGEKSDLGGAMRRAAEFHANWAKERITDAVSWFEPLGILVLGLFVGLVAYAFITPLLSIYQGIK